jgi:FkbM family methyltransferase
MSNNPRQFAKSVLDTLHVYRPVRSLYQQAFGQEARKTHATLRQFYSQFIAPGDLVFDIGANVGIYSEAFESLGAKVVAVEPNPDCVAEIKRNTRRDSVMTIQAAVSDEVGCGTLMLTDCSRWGSMSEEWIEKASCSERFGGAAWSRRIEVPTVTIGDLQSQFGQPRFIKVDVEGYEVKALTGMSEQPEFLSFEFNTENMAIVSACLDCLSPDSSFNFVMGAPPARLELAEWVDRREIQAVLGKIAVLYFGDVMVKAPFASQPAP